MICSDTHGFTNHQPTIISLSSVHNKIDVSSQNIQRIMCFRAVCKTYLPILKNAPGMLQAIFLLKSCGFAKASSVRKNLQYSTTEKKFNTECTCNPSYFE